MKIKDQVTQHVIDGLEAGSPPWIRGWSDDGTKSTLCLAPRNGDSQRPYSGMNWLILGMFSPYKSNEWFTKNQAIKLTGKDRPISPEEFKKGITIIYYNEVSFEDEDGDERFRPIMRT